jgi:sn1-specific diacylglycerol lipase
MPALRLFGRKWLTSSDDFVFPGLFEVCFRVVWLGLISCVLDKYWATTFQMDKCDEKDGLSVRIYLVSVLVLICANLIVLVLLINRSAQGCIIDTAKRKHVYPLLIIKYNFKFQLIIINYK